MKNKWEIVDEGDLGSRDHEYHIVYSSDGDPSYTEYCSIFATTSDAISAVAGTDQWVVESFPGYANDVAQWTYDTEEAALRELLKQVIIHQNALRSEHLTV